MSTPALMIGIMKCSLNAADVGAVKSASVTVKPNYKEHKTAYPQVADLKALMYAEGVCKVECEESTSATLVKDIAGGLSAGLPIDVAFKGDAPGLGGVAMTVSGDGFGSGSGMSGKMEDFGSLTIETTCMSLTFAGGGTPSPSTVAGVPFIKPTLSGQAITAATGNLLFGAPTLGGDLCTQANFNCSGKVKYLCMSWPPVINAAIMESSEFTMTGSFSSGAATALTDATANMVSGTVALIKNHSLSIPTIGLSTVSISMKGMVEPDISFSPGNDWNGISVKISALLSDPTKIGTNWAEIS